MPTPNSRKLNRLKNYDYSQPGCYFLTVCLKNREHFFGAIENAEMQLSDIGTIARKCWLEIPEHFPLVHLDEFVIMPNHIRGIIIVDDSDGGNKVARNAIKNVAVNIDVGNKNFCSLRYRSPKNYLGQNDSPGFPWQTKWSRSVSSVIKGFKIGVTKWCQENDHQCFAWQKSFYDHIIRNEQSLGNIRQYIRDNLMKWELDRNNLDNL